MSSLKKVACKKQKLLPILRDNLQTVRDSMDKLTTIHQ